MATEHDPGPFPSLRSHPHGVIVSVLVVPGASRSEIVGLHGAMLRVRVAAAPERGSANKAVAKLLGDAFSCRCDLLSGARSRVKRFLLRGAEMSAVQARIAAIGR